MITNDTMLVQLTVGQLCEIIDQRVSAAVQRGLPAESPEEPRWGLKELADYLGCSVQHASVIVRSGQYSGAIIHPEGSRRVAFFPEKLNKMLIEQKQ